MAEPKAFCNYVFKEISQDTEIIAGYLLDQVMVNNSENVWELIKRTGDEVVTKETFFKAAKILKRIAKEEINK